MGGSGLKVEKTVEEAVDDAEPKPRLLWLLVAGSGLLKVGSSKLEVEGIAGREVYKK